MKESEGDYLQCLSFTLLQYIYFFNYVYHFCASWHNNKRMLLSSESSRSGFGPWWRENSNGKFICEGKIFRERRVRCAVESVAGVKSSDLCLQKHFLKYYFFFIFALIIEKCNMKKSIRINYNVIDNLWIFFEQKWHILIFQTMFLQTQIRGLHEYERVSQVVFKLKLLFYLLIIN